MKRIGIAVTDSLDWTARSLYEAVIKAGADPIMFWLHDATTAIMDNTVIRTRDIDLGTLDGVIVRDVGGGGGEDLSYRFDVLCNLESSGIPVVNAPGAIQRAANKHMSSYLFKQRGLPAPDTVVTADLDEALDAVRKWGRAVLKPIFGFKGLDIHCLVDDGASRQLLMQTIDRKGVVYLQQFIPNPGRDIRAFVVDGHVAGAIYRAAPPGEWISNLSRGGTPVGCPLSPEIETLACRAAEAVAAVYAGVDLVEGEEGLLILEVNGTPSGRGVFEACGVDAAPEIVKYVLKG